MSDNIDHGRRRLLGTAAGTLAAASLGVIPLAGAQSRKGRDVSEMSPTTAHGIDVDEQGYGTVTEQRLYQLIRQPKPIADRQFEIEFLDPDVETFVFTFG
jgi:hypothetical protein